MANQLEWARKQMDMEMPEQTVTGDDITGREDFVRQACDSAAVRLRGRPFALDSAWPADREPVSLSRPAVHRF